jgi:hypothetical protein
LHGKSLKNSFLSLCLTKINRSGVGWAGDSQPNKTCVCIGFMLGCQKAATYRAKKVIRIDGSYE